MPQTTAPSSQPESVGGPLRMFHTSEATPTSTAAMPRNHRLPPSKSVARIRMPKAIDARAASVTGRSLGSGGGGGGSKCSSSASSTSSGSSPSSDSSESAAGCGQDGNGGPDEDCREV